MKIVCTYSQRRRRIDAKPKGPATVLMVETQITSVLILHHNALYVYLLVVEVLNVLSCLFLNEVISTKWEFAQVFTEKGIFSIISVIFIVITLLCQINFLSVGVAQIVFHGTQRGFYFRDVVPNNNKRVISQSFSVIELAFWKLITFWNHFSMISTGQYTLLQHRESNITKILQTF